MPDEYTILPTASSTLVLSVTNDTIISAVRGVNTIACNVGSYANRMKLLLLIEFRPGGLFPFIKIDQTELADASFSLNDLDHTLKQPLEDVLIRSNSIGSVVTALNGILIDRLASYQSNHIIVPFLQLIVRRHGNIGTHSLSREFCYSEKHIRRLFLQHVGTGPKAFSRIVRTNYALQLIQKRQRSFAAVASEAGFFDESHFIRDFEAICGLTPLEYEKKMSVFYNDVYKL